MITDWGGLGGYRHAAMGALPAPAPYVADVGHDVESFLERCARMQPQPSSPFHAVPWLRAWYATLGRSNGREPLFVAVRRAEGGPDLMLLPLTRRRRAGLWVVEFADAGVVDYNAPLLAADLHLHGSDVSSLLWAAARRALRGHDLAHFEKMPGPGVDEPGLRPNPMAQVLPAVACNMSGNKFHVPGDWDTWRHSLDKHVRKEFERAWRVFTRSPLARFERITDPERAREIFARLEQQQSQRMRSRGVDYVLDQTDYRDFYRLALDGGLADGSAVLTALFDGDALVAAQFGLATDSRYVALRLSIAEDGWKSCSPGRLMCERTARHLHEQGLRWFDFGIGDYAHKETFKVSRIPLFDVCHALSWRGLPLAWAWRVRCALKRVPWLVALVRRLRGRREVVVG